MEKQVTKKHQHLCVERINTNLTQHERTESDLKRRNGGDNTNQCQTRNYLVFNLVHEVRNMRASMPWPISKVGPWLVGGEQARRMADRRTAVRGGGEKSNLLHEEFPKLGATLTVILVCFAQGIGTNIQGGKLCSFTSVNNIVLIDAAPSTSTNRPK